MMKKLVRMLTALVWRRAEREREESRTLYQPPRAEQMPDSPLSSGLGAIRHAIQAIPALDIHRSAGAPVTHLVKPAEAKVAMCNQGLDR